MMLVEPARGPAREPRAIAGCRRGASCGFVEDEDEDEGARGVVGVRRPELTAARVARRTRASHGRTRRGGGALNGSTHHWKTARGADRGFGIGRQDPEAQVLFLDELEVASGPWHLQRKSRSSLRSCSGPREATADNHLAL